MVEKIPGYNKLVLPVHYVQAVKAGMKYKWPAKRLRVIGVTGTNGKTTTCFMIWKMLLKSGYKVGLLTTVGWSENGETLHQQFEHMTTERVEVLNQRMRAIADAGAEFVVLEVTSHALAQYRTLGMPIEIAVFTNLTHEHLDYHGTFNNYREAKGKLFRRAKCGVINIDDKSADWFMKLFSRNSSSSGHAHARPSSRGASSLRPLPVGRGDSLTGELSEKKGTNDHRGVITYGVKSGEVRATNIELSASGVRYSCDGMEIRTRIPGEFNVYNSLAAVCVGKKLGLSDKEIEDGIYALESVEGRMNRIDEGQDFAVIIDYAHTPDALERVFESVKSSDTGKIFAVHGGAGRRDESTRFIRGEILGKYADVVIITEDDSRDEDPEKIAAEFTRGAEKAGKLLDENLFVDLDRRSAIKKALEMAEEGDLVLVLGKGHEKTILRADGAHEFEDIKVTRELLRG